MLHVEVEEEDVERKEIITNQKLKQIPQLLLLPICCLTLNRMKKMKRLKKMTADLILVDSDETDVVFGGEKISKAALEKFIRQYPDSTLRFLLRRSLDGRPLSAEIEAIYYSWEKRGLSRGRLKKYMLKLMEWPEVPDLPILDLLQSLKDRIYEDSSKSRDFKY